MTGARKGRPFGKFWDALAFTRVLKSRRDFLHVDRYIEGNQIEADFGRMERELFFSDPKLYRDRNRGRLAAAEIQPSLL